MNAQLAPSSEHPQHAQALLRTLVITDLCDSTALVERLGDQRTAELIREHDRLLRGLIRRHRGQEVDKTDGFLSLFERPIQAVAFALDYQRDLQAFAREHGVALKARIGIHVGEVMTWQNNSDDVADGAKPMEVEGLAKPIAARLMGLALPGQILLSSVAYTLAHRAEGELGATLSRLKWKHHGRFRFKGVAEAVPVYEIGEPEIAPFRSPAWTGKAHREVPLWRRPVSLALEGLMLLALVALPLWHFLKPEPAIAFAERDWVVLGDLRNLTGDPRFEDSLAQAFRIGLEQSRHVNVVSQLQAREALQRMQRAPDTTPLDRALGAELALREGARALVIPTIAEVGGRLRFTAEVVDPTSQITLLSSSADGSSPESVLNSVDEVNRELRAGLGEALESVDASSQPLEKAATASLDALKAYSLAFDARYENRMEDAIALMRQAIRIDPEFALAHLQLGLLLRDLGEPSAAADAYRRALAHADRLSTSDRLITEASLSEIESTPQETIGRWKVLAELYPDLMSAASTFGFFAWALGNDAETAEQGYRRSLESSVQGPRRGIAYYGLGAVLLAQDRIDESLRAFADYEQTGRRFENQLFASAYAARRDFARAEAVLSRARSSSSPARALSSHGLQIAFALDRGQFDAAANLAAAALSAPRAAAMRPQLAARGWSMTVHWLRAPDQVHGLIEAELAWIDSLTEELIVGSAPSDLRRYLSLLTVLAATESPHMAQVLNRRATDGEDASAYPELQQRILASGLVASCSMGTPVASPPAETTKSTYLLGWARMTCLTRRGDSAGAAEAAQRLIERRGKAYSEIHGDYLFWAINIAASNLAWLHLAEVSAPDSEARKIALAGFTARWPKANLPEHLRLRVERLGG